jgi:type IV pilus assembly protein PilQ
MKRLGCKAILLFIISLFGGLAQATVVLQDASYRSIASGQAEIYFKFSSAPNQPKVFSIKNPNKIILDLPDSKNNMDVTQLNEVLSQGFVKDVHVVENNKKMRIVVSLEDAASFEVKNEGNDLVLNIVSQLSSLPKVLGPRKDMIFSIKNFDFQRGEKGQGKLIVNLSSSNLDIDVSEEGEKLIARFMHTRLPDKFQETYNVLDFSTSVNTIKMMQDGSDAVMELWIDKPNSEKISYQLDNQFVIEVSSPAGTQVNTDSGTKTYSGEKLSLNFQDVEVRAVLQVLADFSNFNLVTSDNVKGSITLRLQNVPWDQALDIILRTKGLEKRENGNVVLIGPAQEILASEKTELTAEKDKEDTIALKSEIIQINYALAADMAALLKQQSSGGAAGAASTVTNALLSSRGSVTVDTRTNALLIQDTPKKLTQIRELIRKLDKPVQQVEIATQIVKATSTITDALGFKLGGASSLGFGHRRIGLGSNVAKARGIVSSTATGTPVPAPNPVTATLDLEATTVTNPTVTNTEGFFHTLGSGISGAGSVGFALARLPAGTLLDLELQALESLALTKVISRPRLLTQDQVKATVTQGTEIPYTDTTTGVGGTALLTTSFKDATLSFEVTPHITPDKRVLMDITLSNDEQSSTTNNGVPVIDTNKLITKVLSDNGETIVLGGIFKNSYGNTVTKIPYLGDIPFLGRLFRSKSKTITNNEILIFVTPKIVSYE